MENNQTKEKLQKEIERLKKELKKKKKYGLVWEEKSEDVVEMCKNKLPVLKEVKSKGIITDKNKPVNLLIEGDNYHALSVLNYTHAKKIDVIYIDPPYNTGNKDFIFNDRYIDREDGYRHSKWLAFMEKRLKLAKNLLSQNGALICSIGEDELGTLILLLQSIYKFVSEPLVWLSKSILNQNKISKTSAISHEYIIIASNKEVESKKEKLDLTKNISYLTNEEKDKINNYPLSIILKKKLEFYSVNDVNGKKIVLIPPRDFVIKNGYDKNSFCGHRFQKRTFQEGHGSERYIKIYKKITPSDNYLGVILEVKDKNNLGVKFVINNSYFQSISNEPILKMPSFLGLYQGGYPGFSTAKPEVLIRRLVNNYSFKNSIILDFFAGSGTTGEAVVKLNNKDNGTRRFILCTDNRDGNSNHRIAERICYPRIKKLSSNLKYFKTDFVNYDEPTDRNKIKLTEEAIEMLCIKEGTFEEIENRVNFKIFKNSIHYTGIIFDQAVIPAFKKAIKDIRGKFSVYIFSLGDETFDDEFKDVKQKVQLSPIPEAILKVYRRIFK